MIRPSNKAVAMLLVMACLLSACGGGKKKASADVNAQGSAPRAQYTWPPVMPAVDDRDLSYAILVGLRQGDFPSGWTSGVPIASTSPREAVEDEDFVQCMFGPNPSTLTAYSAGLVFQSADQNTVYKSFTRVVGSKSAGASDFKSMTADRIGACQTSMYDLEQNPPDGVPVIGAKYGKAQPLQLPVDVIASPEGTKDVRSYRMVVAPSDYLTTYQDVFAYGAGRYEVVVLVQSTATPDAALEKTIIATMKGRARSAASLG